MTAVLHVGLVKWSVSKGVASGISDECPAMLSLRSCAAAASVTMLIAATPLPAYRAVIVGSGISSGRPIVTDIVNRRMPDPPQVLRVVVEPEVAPSTPVHWSSPDGKNDIAIGSWERSVSGAAGLSYDTTLDYNVGVYPHHHARGEAIIIADVGSPVNVRATFHVRDEIGIGFGCYWFTASGPSVRIVDGLPESSSLADADVAVVGPGNRDGAIPGYGCWGDNYDAKASTVRLTFRRGGRVLRDSLPHTFVKELPYEAVDEAHPLDILSGAGRTYRLHVRPLASTYFVGWMEEVDDQGNPVER